MDGAHWEICSQRAFLGRHVNEYLLTAKSFLYGWEGDFRIIPGPFTIGVPEISGRNFSVFCTYHAVSDFIPAGPGAVFCCSYNIREMLLRAGFSNRDGECRYGKNIDC